MRGLCGETCLFLAAISREIRSDGLVGKLLVLMPFSTLSASSINNPCQLSFYKLTLKKIQREMGTVRKLLIMKKKHMYIYGDSFKKTPNTGDRANKTNYGLVEQNLLAFTF